MSQTGTLYSVPVCFALARRDFFLNISIDRRTDGTANQLLTNC
jgi:hypothetical protein